MHALRCSDGSSTTTTATTTTGGAGAIAAAGGSSGIVSGTSILQLQQQQQQQQVQQQQCPSQQQQQQLPKGGPVRINGVKGYQNRTNHIIYCPPLLRSKEDCTAVVYFGGDVQSDGHSTTSNNSTNNASTSSPSSSSTADINELLWWRESLNLDKANLALMGFSKGCVVLNQFIYEFHYYKTLTPDDSTMMRLVSRIKDMYWLDGGHGGGKNTWITSRSLLETLCRLGINVHVHVTPYQIQDDHRPWIRKEEKAFTDLLKRLGAPFDRHLYPSEANSTNLFTHFEVLNRFRQYQINVFAQQHLQAQAQAQQQVQQQQLTATNLSTTGTNSVEEQQQQQPILTQLEQMGVVGAGGNSIVTAVDAVEQMITGGGNETDLEEDKLDDGEDEEENGHK
ncbi:hypothetical protein quinque_015080 [Culex quinquefasciatus]